MFKFIHAADIHLDSPLRGLARYEGAPVDAIRGATRRAFEALTDLAIANEVAFVLLAGDLYDGDWKDYNTGLFFNRQMTQLDRAGIRVFVVSGNHDAQSKITASLRPPDNTQILSSRRPVTREIRELEVAIHGQSYAKPVVKEDLASSYPPPIPGYFNIGLLHTSLDGRPGHEPYAPCSLDTLRSKGYDYWALGHVHTREVVSEDPHVVFPGCLQGRHIRESGAKGCTLVTVADGEVVDIEHHDLDVVRWLECHVSVDGLDTGEAFEAAVEDSLRRALSRADGRPMAARVLVEGRTPCHRKLQSNPSHYENLVRTIGIEVDDERVWIEKVTFRTSDQRTLEESLAEGSPLSPVLRAIVDFPTTIEPGSRLFEEISTLKTKLPHELFDGADGMDVQDAATIANIINDAKEHLLARLLSEGLDS